MEVVREASSVEVVATGVCAVIVFLVIGLAVECSVSGEGWWAGVRVSVLTVRHRGVGMVFQGIQGGSNGSAGSRWVGDWRAWTVALAISSKTEHQECEVREPSLFWRLYVCGLRMVSVGWMGIQVTYRGMGRGNGNEGHNANGRGQYRIGGQVLGESTKLHESTERNGGLGEGKDTTGVGGVTVGTFILSGATSVWTPSGDVWLGTTGMLPVTIVVGLAVCTAQRGKGGELGYIVGGLTVALGAWSQGQGNIGVVVGIAAVTNATIWYWLGFSGEGSTVGGSTAVGVIGLTVGTLQGMGEGEGTESTGTWPTWVLLMLGAVTAITSLRAGTQGRVMANGVTAYGLATGINELILVIIVCIALGIPAFIRAGTRSTGTSTAVVRERQAQGIYECGPRAEAEHSQYSQPGQATDEAQLFLSLDLPIASALLAYGQPATALALIGVTSQTSRH